MGSHAKELLTWTEEDERRLRFYAQFVSPGDLVFDVGANFGNRTKVLLRLGASVVAFEPQRVWRTSCTEYSARTLRSISFRKPLVQRWVEQPYSSAIVTFSRHFPRAGWQSTPKWPLCGRAVESRL